MAQRSERAFLVDKHDGVPPFINIPRPFHPLGATYPTVVLFRFLQRNSLLTIRNRSNRLFSFLYEVPVKTNVNRRVIETN